MTQSRVEWLIPVGLIALSIIPLLAGVVRLAELSSGATITIENARFHETPLPVVLHIFSSLIFCVLGAFQFVPNIRRKAPSWHKNSGRVLIPCGLISAASGLWMTQFYSGAEFNSPALYWLRITVGAAMLGAISLSLIAIRNRNFTVHGVWMIRSYALGLGAGTQVLTLLPLIIFQLGSVSTVFISMVAGWGINFLVAEWIIRKRLVVGKNNRVHHSLPAM